MAKIKVGVLGATGTVGQRFVELLENHPRFEVSELAASEKSAGKRYGELMVDRWKISGDIPEYARDMVVKECVAKDLDCDVVFSGMDSSVAGPIETSFAENGFKVVSNCKNHRMDPYVPLLIPEVNADHLRMVEKQGTDGFIVTNPNCSTIGLVLALAPVHREFGIRKVLVTTMQALSGAGYPGVPSMDIIDNVVPFIGGEEPKMESETLKILGSVENDAFVDAEMAVSAQCNRVQTRDGHLETVNLELSKKASPEEIKEAMRRFNPLKGMGLSFAPDPPILVREEDNRPQPRLDRDAGRGMAAVVGRVRKCPVLDVKFVVLSHNTIRGAAGAAILNAELLDKEKLI